MVAAFRGRVGARIRSLRVKRKLSQTDLAFACRVREGTITRWERGLQDIGLAHAQRVCSVLGIGVADLIRAGRGR